MAQLDRDMVKQRKREANKRDEVGLLKEIQNCDEQIISDLQKKNADLQSERDQLLARVAEVEKGIQEGGDLVE